MSEDLVIDEENFLDYFRPVENGPPKEGEILANFKSMAELHDGEIKREIVRLLSTEDIGAKMAIQVMEKLCKADKRWATRVITQICSDIYHGMNLEDVYKRKYEFMVHMSFYTKKEYVPKDNKHWSTLELEKTIKIDDQTNNIINDEKVIKEENKGISEE
jgi:hypothetical protein